MAGGGGHGVVVADWARCDVAGAWDVAGFFDDDASRVNGVIGARLGDVAALTSKDRGWLAAHAVVVAIGDEAARRRVVRAIEVVDGIRFGVVVHQRAVASAHAQIEAGAAVGPTAVVNAGARVGAHAIVNTGAIVEHDCVVGARSHIAPGAVLGGGVVVGEDCLVGLGARVLPGVRIGDGVVVGAGAVVVRDVGDGDVVKGVPAG